MASRPDWLNEEFALKILKEYEGNESVELTKLDVKPATNKGDNYTSDMLRLFVDYKTPSGQKSKSFIAKIAPTTNGVQAELVARAGLFPTEIRMMTETLSAMNALLGADERVSATAYYVQKEHPNLLVFEDLAPLGFRMADRQAGLDLEHCLLAIRALAKFHGTSVFLYEKDPEKITRYGTGIFNAKHPPEMTGFFVAGTRTFADEIATWPDFGERYADKVRALADVIYAKATEAAVRKDGEFAVLNHGDFWVNNMLFRYDDSGRPIGHIFVDFQLSYYTSPAIDLLYFISTSLSHEVYTQQMSTILHEYRDTLTSTLSKLGCKTAPPSYEELKDSLKKHAFYGVVSSFTVLPIVLIDKDEAQALDEIMSTDGNYTNKSYKGKIYRKVMMDRLPKYDHMGLLDL